MITTESNDWLDPSTFLSMLHLTSLDTTAGQGFVYVEVLGLPSAK